MNGIEATKSILNLAKTILNKDSDKLEIENNDIENNDENNEINKEKELARRLFKIPIVACSAYSSKDYIDQCLEAGCCDFIVKPINV